MSDKPKPLPLADVDPNVLMRIVGKADKAIAKGYARAQVKIAFETAALREWQRLNDEQAVSFTPGDLALAAAKSRTKEIIPDIARRNLPLSSIDAD